MQLRYLSTVCFAFTLLLPSQAFAQLNNPYLSKLPSPINSSQKQSIKSIDSDWYKYTAKDNSYTVFFPQSPEEQTTNIMGVNAIFVGYNDSTKGRYYMSNGTKLPMQIDTNYIDTDLLFNFTLDNLAKKTDFIVTYQNNITYAGFPGREAIIVSKNGNMFAKVRYVLDTKTSTLYQVMVMSQDKDLSFPEISAFFNSLTIL